MARRIIILFIILLISLPVMAVEEKVEALPYLLSADGEISFDSHLGILSAEGNAYFQRGDIELKADILTVNSNEELIKAEGDSITFILGEQVFQGSALEFNYNTMTGSILDPVANLKDLSFSGSKISLAESERYEIDSIELTPCVFPEPHYSFKAKKVIVYPDEKIVASNVWFYFAGHRVFYLPSYTVKYNQESDDFDEVSPLPELGYNTEDGFYLKMAYPYDISADFSGEINGEINQYEDKYFRMDNTYNLTEQVDIVNSYLYEDIEEDDGDIIKTNQLGAGLSYQGNGFNIYTGMKRDFIINSNLYEFDGRYRYNRINFRYFNEFKESELDKEIYGINYNSRYPLELIYKKGYDIEYLPYLKVNKLNYRIAGIGINSSLGIGKVANKEIVSDKFRLDMNINKSLITTDHFNLSANTLLESNYYKAVDDLKLIEGNNKLDNMYNFYKVGFDSSYQNNLTDRFEYKAKLAYNYSWDTGNAYLPEDKNDTHEYLNPGLGISYRIPEELSAWHLNLDASYEIREENLEELNLTFKRELDCFDYYIGVDIIDKSLELGINF